MLSRADKWLVGILLFAAACGVGAGLFFFPAAGNRTAQIYKDGVLVKTLPLRAGYREEFRIGGAEHYNIIEVQDSHIRVRDADCPDQICVRTGWVSTAPQQIVCLPWRVVIKVVSAEDTDIDDIAR